MTAQTQQLQEERTAIKEAAEESQNRVEQLQRTQRVLTIIVMLTKAPLGGTQTAQGSGEESPIFTFPSRLESEFDGIQVPPGTDTTTVNLFERHRFK